MRKVFFAALMLLLATAAEGATLTETIDRTIDVRPGAALTLSNVNGRVTVTAWDQPRVHIVARKEVEAARDEVQDVMKALRVEIVAKDGGVLVKTHHPKRSEDGMGFFEWLLGGGVDAEVRYDITVPRSMNVEVENTNGSIRLSNVSGRHDLETTNGKIEVAGCAGTLEASTTNGSISAELVKADAAAMSLETTNGRIEIAVPSTFAASIDAATTNGAIKTDLPVATTRLERNSLRGSINGGGPTLRLRTTNGGIEIRAAGKS
jgi:hypothetical protein